MKPRLFLVFLGLGLLLLAVAAWALQGLRWTLTAPLRPRVAAAGSAVALPLLLLGRPF